MAINRLRLDVMLGAFDEERSVPQTVFADIALDVDADAACSTDALEDTVNYRTLADSVVAAVCRGREFHLVEALASAIADICLAADARVRGAKVAVEKPAALTGLAASATVTIRKSKGRPSSL